MRPQLSELSETGSLSTETVDKLLACVPGEARKKLAEPREYKKKGKKR